MREDILKASVAPLKAWLDWQAVFWQTWSEVYREW